MANQDTLFWEFEGDNWFKRNSQILNDKEKIEKDIPLNLLKKLKIYPKSVLEIGASNGYRLAEIRKIYNSRCIAIEPSKEAIKDGEKNYPGIKFRRGLASELPLIKDETFDLVIMNFVFHWVSRETLLKSVAEIDRAIAKGGYLLIGDFLPDYPKANNYHHLPKGQVYTYKLDYAKIFLSSGFYKLVKKMIFNHDDLKNSDITSENRATCCLLKKKI